MAQETIKFTIRQDGMVKEEVWVSMEMPVRD